MTVQTDVRTASFECCKCKRKFRALPGPQTSCPSCHNLYCKWMEYDRWVKGFKKSAAYEKAYALK